MILDLLCRTEELERQKDSVDNFESPHTERRWEAPLYYPVVNRAIMESDPHWLDEIQWPQGKRFAACLTHDVDTLQLHSRRELARTIGLHVRHSATPTEQIKHLLSSVGLRKRPLKVDIFTPWLDVEHHFGFHSSFFFFAEKISQRHVRDNVYRWQDPTWWKGRYVPAAEAIREIHQRGWDVGLHGSYLSCLSEQLLLEQKMDLESMLGDQVYTTRQHNLHYDSGITPILQDRVGFQADSTLGFNRDIGFRAGIAYPFRSWDRVEGRWLGTLQVPLILQDSALLRADNLDLNEEAAYHLSKKFIDRVAETKGVVTLLWHPDNTDRPSWFRLYARLLEYIDHAHGWGASVKEIHDWWIGQGLLEKLEERLANLRA